MRGSEGVVLVLKGTTTRGVVRTGVGSGKGMDRGANVENRKCVSSKSTS